MKYNFSSVQTGVAHPKPRHLFPQKTAARTDLTIKIQYKYTCLNPEVN